MVKGGVFFFFLHTGFQFLTFSEFQVALNATVHSNEGIFDKIVELLPNDTKLVNAVLEGLLSPEIFKVRKYRKL